MKFFNILQYPDPKLRIKAQNVTKDELKNIEELAKNIAYTMYKAEGVGLAATQVGINKRIIAIDVGKKFDANCENFLKDKDILFLNKNLIIAINPEIIYREGKIVHEEGCLSIPGFNADIERAKNIKVRAVGLDGKEFITESEGILSIAFQHEIDHLDGVLFIDKASPLKRTLYNAKLKKLKFEEKAH
jgi:peptide deformylase